MGFNSLERETKREGNFIWHLYAYLLCFLFLRVFLFKHIPKKNIGFWGLTCANVKGVGFYFTRKIVPHALTFTKLHTPRELYRQWGKRKRSVRKKVEASEFVFLFFFLGALIKYHRCRLVGRYVYVSSRAYFAPFLNNNDYMGMRMGWCFESKLARKNQLL